MRLRLRDLPRVFVGLVLMATGTGKLLDLAGFIQVVRSYDLVPDAVAGLLGAALPPFELGVGVALLGGWRVRWAGLGAVGLHAMLVSAVLLTLARGHPVPNCGCFGVFLARPLTRGTLVEDLVMLAFSLAVVALAPNTQPRGAVARSVA